MSFSSFDLFSRDSIDNSGPLTPATDTISNGLIDISLTAVDDFGLEGDEALTFAIAGAPDSYAIGDLVSTLTIQGNNAATVSIAATDATASETDDSGQFTVMLSNPSDTETVTLTLNSVISGNVNITVDAAPATVNLIDDDLAEVNLAFGFEAAFPSSFDLASLDSENGFLLNDIDSEDFSSRSVSAAGDVNGDGIDDLIISIYLTDAKGKSHVVLGSGNGFVINGVNSGDLFGNSVSSAGDINSDGRDDLIIGAPLAEPDSDKSFSGQSYVLFGSTDDFNAGIEISELNIANGFVLNGDDFGGSGISISGAGDVNDGGIDDIIIGAQFANDTGASYLVFGSASTPIITDILLEGSAATLSIYRTDDGIGSVDVAINLGGTASLDDYSFSIGALIENANNAQLIVTVPAEQEQVDVAITAVDDGVLEDNETLIFTIEDDPSYAINNGSGMLTIADDDAATVSIAPIADAAEPNTHDLFTVRLSNPSETDTVLPCRVSGQATPDVDYAALSGEVTILARETTADTDVSTLDDSVAEASETLTITLESMVTESSAISLDEPNRTATLLLLSDIDITPDEDLFNFEQYVLQEALEEDRWLVLNPVILGDVPIAKMFDETYYLANNSDVANAVKEGTFSSGYDHFVQFGWLEGRNPSTLFKEAFYRSENPDVDAAIAEEGFNSGFQHHMMYGHVENRRPSELFDPNDSLLNNPDVQNAVDQKFFTSSFQHFVSFGLAEGRSPDMLLFNENHYLQQYDDVRMAIANQTFDSGYQHYLLCGQREGRNPSLHFNEASYRTLNPDVARAVDNGLFASGFEHYLEFGRAEGRDVFA